MSNALPPVDPHDPELTALRIARHLAEVVRALNYATRPGDGRLDNGPDAYSVIGALREAMAKLPQACGQLAALLHAHDSEGGLRAERGFAHAGDPRQAVVTAAAMLGDAADASARASGALGRAQSAISGLSHGEPEPVFFPARRSLPVSEPTRHRGVER